MVSAEIGSRRALAINELTGRTTKKYTAAAMSKKDIRELTKSPYKNRTLLNVKLRLEKSGAGLSRVR